MSRAPWSVLVAGASYAAFTAAYLAVIVRLSNPLLPVLALTVVGAAFLAVGSAWVARSTGERDIILPAVTAALGWSTGIMVFALVTPQLRSIEFIIGPVLRALSLGLIVRLAQTPTPVPLFTVAGQDFGFGIPWPLLIIYSAVFWNRRRARVFIQDESAS